MTVSQQSFGVATSSSGFTGVDGILGVGPVDLTKETVSNVNTVPTFPDNLYSQGSIVSKILVKSRSGELMRLLILIQATEVLGVYFKPESGSDTDDANGELTFGGTDATKYTGSITEFPKTILPPFSEYVLLIFIFSTSDLTGKSLRIRYWGLSGITFTYKNKLLPSASISAIVDTGTTLIYIPTGAYNAFKSATSGTTDSNSGLLSFTTKPTGTFTIMIDGKKFPLTPAQYLVPPAQ